MIQSESIKELATALSAFQGEVKSVSKDAVNPFYKSKYASLDTIWESIKPLLKKHGLAVAQFPDENGLTTILMHNSGEWLYATSLIHAIKDDPQAVGSALTYARRYALSACLGISADEDDDAEVATRVKTPPSPQKATSKPVVTHRASEQEAGEVDIPQFEDSKHMMGWLCSKTSLDFKGITAKAEQNYKELKTQEDMQKFAKKVINEKVS